MIGSSFTVRSVLRTLGLARCQEPYAGGAAEPRFILAVLATGVGLLAGFVANALIMGFGRLTKYDTLAGTWHFAIAILLAASVFARLRTHYALRPRIPYDYCLFAIDIVLVIGSSALLALIDSPCFLQPLYWLTAAALAGVLFARNARLSYSYRFQVLLGQRLLFAGAVAALLVALLAPSQEVVGWIIAVLTIAAAVLQLWYETARRTQGAATNAQGDASTRRAEGDPPPAHARSVRQDQLEERLTDHETAFWLRRLEATGKAQSRYLWLTLIACLSYLALRPRALPAQDIVVPIVDLRVDSATVLASGGPVLSFLVLVVVGAIRAWTTALEKIRGKPAIDAEPLDHAPNAIDLAVYTTESSPALAKRILSFAYPSFLAAALGEAFWIAKWSWDVSIAPRWLLLLIMACTWAPAAYLVTVMTLKRARRLGVHAP